MKRLGQTKAGVRWRAAAVLVVIGALIWAACAGGDGTGSGLGQSSAAPCQSLNQFERFRYTFSYKIESPQPQGPVDAKAVGEPSFAILPNAATFELQQVYNGSFIRPDRYMIRIDSPSEEDAPPIELLFVGEQSWVNAGGQWQLTAAPLVFAPMLVCESILSGVDLAGLAASAETVDGQAVSRFRLEDAQLGTAASLFGAESDMGRLLKSYSVDILLAEDGWPVRLEVGSESSYPSGRDMAIEISLEIKDVNAKDIEIEPPQ